MCCILCFSDAPNDKDPHAHSVNQWRVSLLSAPCKEPTCWLLSCVFCSCSAYKMRVRALEGNMDNYRCCQGYSNFFCFKAGCLGEENCPELCLCLESCICLGLAVSATRQLVRDQFDLRSDPCDNRMIRFSNFLQITRCIFRMIGCEDVSRILDLIADIVFYSLQACMTAQVHHELNVGAGAVAPEVVGSPQYQVQPQVIAQPMVSQVPMAIPVAGGVPVAAAPQANMMQRK